MKYYFEGFIIGLIVYWIVTSLAIFLESTSFENPYLAMSVPLMFWGVWAMIEFQNNQREKELRREIEQELRKNE